MQDAPGLGLHRVTVLARADAQPLFDRRVQVADRDCCFCPDTIVVINDRIDVKLPEPVHTKELPGMR
jgi:hypothetical protein